MGLRLSGLIAITAACLQLAACSTYGGPVTNAQPPAGLTGPPLLTHYYSP